MSLTQDKAVTILPLRILRINVHFAAVQYGKRFDDGHRAADVPQAESVKLLQRCDTDFLGKDAQSLRISRFFHCINLDFSMVIALKKPLTGPKASASLNYTIAFSASKERFGLVMLPALLKIHPEAALKV